MDDDRLTDYIARVENPRHRRTIHDGCTGPDCGVSRLACNAGRYLDRGPCCTHCQH
jgi:hypothetical protein